MNVKAIRNKFGYTQAKFGQVVGISHYTICKIERGVIRPTPQMKQKLKDFCDKHNLDFQQYVISDFVHHVSRMYSPY